MPSTNEVLNVLRTIAAMNTTAFGLEVAGTATLDELQIPGSAYIGLVTQLRDAVHSASAPLPSARELLDGMKLDPFFSLEEVAGRFCRAVATAPPVCPDMALPGTPDDEDC